MKAEREAMDRFGTGLGVMRIARDHAVAALFNALFAPSASFVRPEKEQTMPWTADIGYAGLVACHLMLAGR